jgi:hypothetical protein
MQSIIAFPLWVFNDSNYGNIALAELNDTSSLPAEYHTTDAVASPFTRIVVNESMFILFMVLEVSNRPRAALSALLTEGSTSLPG